MRHILNKKTLQSRGFRRIAALAAIAFSFGIAHGQELNVYSHRHYAIDGEINRLFEEETGIKVNVVSAEADQLIERLKSEGETSPADVLITVDAGRMQRAKEDGLLGTFDSDVLKERVPEAFRDKDGAWYAYAIRARVILYAKDRVKANELKNYEDLADPKWRGRLLIRSSSSGYNQALLASIIEASGEDEAEKWARGVVANMARPPQGGDRDQIKAVAAGLADVCVSNTYYLGLLLNSTDEKEREAANKVAVCFPNQDGRGTHVNVSATALTKHSKNQDNAKKYFEFLTSPEIQKVIANGSYEFPVDLDGPSLAPVHEAWGDFKPDTETFPKLGDHQETAMRIFDSVGWK